MSLLSHIRQPQRTMTCLTLITRILQCLEWTLKVGPLHKHKALLCMLLKLMHTRHNRAWSAQCCSPQMYALKESESYCILLYPLQPKSCDGFHCTFLSVTETLSLFVDSVSLLHLSPRSGYPCLPHLEYCC